MASSSTGSAAVVAQARRDSRQDQITLLRGSAIIALGYGVGAALQSTYVYANLVPEWESVSLGSRLAANGTAVAFAASREPSDTDSHAGTRFA